MGSARAQRIETRTRHPQWRNPPLRIEVLECIDCDKCVPACPPQFGAIVHHGLDVVIIPELCSGCDKCLPVCPVDCILPFPDWETTGSPVEWWDAALPQVDQVGHTAAMTAALIPGADAWSHTADTSDAPGALVLHGFTGNPGSMRGLAEAFAAAGFHVEMPRLPGHGTTVDDMLTTWWPDWLGEAEAAYARLAERASSVVVAGLSMGGALTLHVGAAHPEVKGLVCINPATQPQPPEVVAMLQEMVDGGTTVMPAIGSDIADPDSTESAYDATPIPQLLSLVNDGLAPLADLLPSMSMPLLLLHSTNDHVVEPAQSAYLMETYGGPVEEVVLERSFHVATQDYDKDIIFERSVAFASALTAS